MSRQLISRAAQFFLGPLTYALANAGKPGVEIDLALKFKDYGVISTADADGACASQSVSSGVAALINGALASGGVATFATPRNVVAAWTNTAILTITGTDEYGAVLIETTASGTSHTGKKAFKTITSVVPNANITGATVGEGVVIGLPHRVDENGLLAARLDGAIDVATFVEADTTTATGTTGDIRGTVSFSAAPNGTRKFAVFYKIAGVSTKALAYGVSQYTG
jgi:hypothetical protein